MHIYVVEIEGKPVAAFNASTFAKGRGSHGKPLTHT